MENIIFTFNSNKEVMFNCGPGTYEDLRAQVTNGRLIIELKSNDILYHIPVWLCQHIKKEN